VPAAGQKRALIKVCYASGHRCPGCAQRSCPTGNEAKEIATELHTWLAKVVGPSAISKDIRFGDNLPKARSGKIKLRLQHSFANGESTTNGTSTPENPAIRDQFTQGSWRNPHRLRLKASSWS
jgi:hypothetical protein